MNAVVQFQPQPVQQFTMSDMERVALAIAKGGLFGSNDPNAVLTLCMVAAAEGKHPGLVMQQYHLINGKPAKKAEAMLVDFLASGGRVEWHRLDDEAADATFTHPQGGEARISWDIARAKKAQLNSPMWGKYPRQMLRSRVVSEGVRTVFPGATSGMYVPEEVMDFEDKPARATPPAPTAQRARDIQADKPALSDQRSQGREKAEEWLRGHLEAIDTAASAEDLDTIIQAGSKALTKLGREHPDLHDQAVTAANDRGRYFVEQASPAANTAPESEDAEVAELLDHLSRKVRIVDVNSLMSDWRGKIEGWSEENRTRVAEAHVARVDEIKAAQA